MGRTRPPDHRRVQLRRFQKVARAAGVDDVLALTRATKYRFEDESVPDAEVLLRVLAELVDDKEN